MNRAGLGSASVSDAAPALVKGRDQAAYLAVPARAPLGHFPEDPWPDVDDPHERAREDPPTRCAIEQLRRALADREDREAIAIRRFLAARDRAIAKGDVTPHQCIDAAAARG